MSFQGWLLAWIRHRKSKVDVCIPTSSHDVCANVGGNGCGLIDIGVGAFTLIEALVYMRIIDIYLPFLVRLDKSPFRIRFPNLVSVYKKMASNGPRVLGCVVRTYS